MNGARNTFLVGNPRPGCHTVLRVLSLHLKSCCDELARVGVGEGPCCGPEGLWVHRGAGSQVHCPAQLCWCLTADGNKSKVRAGHPAALPGPHGVPGVSLSLREPERRNGQNPPGGAGVVGERCRQDASGLAVWSGTQQAEGTRMVKLDFVLSST